MSHEPVRSVGTTNRLLMFMSNALVVRSMDLMITLSFGVMGELACLSGLKFKMALRILFAMDGRVRMRVPTQLRVALTNTASLQDIISSIYP